MNKFKKGSITIILLFIVLNIWIYSVTYKDYVIKAPEVLKEARKDFVSAYVIHIYYAFFVKSLGIDFQSKLLSPIKESRDYFYHKALKKLPKNESEAAVWFSLFEANLYNFSMRGVYGRLAKKYGKDFAEQFIEKLYKNIELFSLNNFNDRDSKLNKNILEEYLNFIYIYTGDFHLNEKKLLFSKENMKKVSTNKKLHERFINIYKWYEQILNYYKVDHSVEYERIISSHNWNTPYMRNKQNISYIASFILFYKITNNIFDCEKDKIYLNKIDELQTELLNHTKKYKITKKQMNSLKYTISYTLIKNTKKEQKFKSNNPLNLTINCE
ncbi:hypothetical protein ACH5BF_00340 [Arcobacter sp. YIC-464]|uniref:hypothetical protein n=1 Tax=Arcobacter sp. YIC-464 TaxID=3376631 RepID=UPI003C1DCA59